MIFIDEVNSGLLRAKFLNTGNGVGVGFRVGPVVGEGIAVDVDVDIKVVGVGIIDGVGVTDGVGFEVWAVMDEVLAVGAVGAVGVLGVVDEEHETKSHSEPNMPFFKIDAMHRKHLRVVRIPFNKGLFMKR